MRKHQYFFAIIAFGTSLVAFQNCANKDFTWADDQFTSSGFPSTTTTTSESLRAFKPVLAVGGINCMACHGQVSANIVTDFGISSGNFRNDQNFFGNGTRTAFNDVDYSGLGGWGSLAVSGGSIIVPRIALTAAQTKAMAGTAKDLSMAELMRLPINNHSMVDLVTPAVGHESVIEYSNVKIAYPSAAEILALVPNAQATQSVLVAPIAVAGEPSPRLSGLVLDASGKFVRNTAARISCYGDVVVKGVLFLKDVIVQTDERGCRLYVSSTAFLQGGVIATGSPTANIQITSARAVIMGISAERMGYAGAGANSVRKENNSLTTAGGPWARFLPSNDTAYSPLNTKINGIDRSVFFDQIVLDAVSVGSELLDAGDAASVNQLTSGESISTEPGSSENANTGGPRVSINYSHLLLNAPHVHSRYAGTFEGSIVADVAMMARNPTGKQLEQFTYDPVFNDVPTIFPALSTTILELAQ